MKKLDPSTVSLLNHLIEVCRDGYFAYQVAKRYVKSAELQGYFNLVSQERLRFGQELLLELFKSDGELGGRGRTTVVRPLPWQVAEHRLCGQDDKFILRELVCLEDGALKLYETARRKPLLAELRGLLKRQYEDTKRVRNYVQTESVIALERFSGSLANCSG